MFQKLVNICAVASAAVSVAVVGTGAYVYLNKDAIVEDIKNKALESVLGGGLGGAAGGVDLPSPELGVGANDLVPSAPQSSGSDAALAPQAPLGL